MEDSFMLIHVKKSSFLAFALSLTWHTGFAQGAPAAAPAPPAPSASGVDGATSSTLDYLFNHQAQQGTTAYAAQQGAKVLEDKIRAMDAFKTPGLDDPAVRARFETYLSLKEVPQDRIKEYFGKMAQVTQTLKAGDSFGAWKILYSLSEYQDLDAGISRELAARVETFWNTDRTKNGLEMANTKYRNDAATATHNADLDAQDLKYQQDQQLQKTKQGGSSNGSNASASNTTNSPLLNPDADPVAAEAALMPTMGSALQGKMEMGAEYLNLLEARAKIKLNEIRENRMSDQDRLDFSDYIKTLYKSHRYYHVIIAADFYRALFNEGDYPSDLANQAVAGVAGNARTASESAHLAIKSLGLNASGPASALNQLGGLAGGDALGAQQEQPVSIADEVTSAMEINERVSQAIEGFTYKADKGDIAAASEQLQEAFVGNEYHPALQGLHRDQKEKVGDFLDKLSVLRSQLENRTFELVDDQISQIKKIATDFDATEPTAMAHTAQVQSMMLLGQATIAAQKGNEKLASDSMAEALEIWPTNPKLMSGASTYFSQKDEGNELTSDFDRDVRDQNYRAIYEKALAFGPAVKDDPARVQQLKDAVEKVKTAEAASEKANYMVMNGDVNGAWETIELAAKDWPDDMKLNKLLAELSGRSADFVSALNKARDAEAKKQLGYSLTWYVAAQGYYPPSQIANDGIDRVSKLILSPPQSASPTAEAN